MKGRGPFITAVSLEPLKQSLNGVPALRVQPVLVVAQAGPYFGSRFLDRPHVATSTAARNTLVVGSGTLTTLKSIK